MSFAGIGRSVTRSVCWTALLGSALLWLICMLCLTLTRADALRSIGLQSAVENTKTLHEQTDRYFSQALRVPELPGGLGWAAQESANQQLSIGGSRYRRLFLLAQGGTLQAQTGTLVVDAAGAVAAEPAGVISFPYLDEAGQTAGFARAYLEEQPTGDRDALDRVSFGEWSVDRLYDWKAYRITGRLTDGRLVMTGIQGQKESQSPWETLWEAEGGPAGETLQVDFEHLNWSIPETQPDTPIFYSRAWIFEDMDALLRGYVDMNTIRQGNERQAFGFNQTKLTDCIQVSVHWIMDESGAPRFCLLTGLRFSPLGAAMGELIWTYLATFLCALLLPLHLVYRIKKHVEDPLRTVNDDWDKKLPRSSLVGYQQSYRELARLVAHYDGIADMPAQADMKPRTEQTQRKDCP